MIGQTNLKQNFKLHHFNIIVGEQGQGKKTFVNEYVKTLNYNIVYLDASIDSIRTLINSVYDIATPTIYIIFDADNMQVRAKNAMLKIAEEPPENIYIIMTLCDLKNTLSTIISRATVYQMDNYTKEELKSYKDIDVSLCENIQDVIYMSGYDIALFNKYINNIISKVNRLGYNSLFKIKELLTTFDTKLVFKAVINECIKQNELQKAYITNQYLSKLRMKNLNQDLLIDNWLLDMNGVK